MTTDFIELQTILKAHRLGVAFHRLTINQKSKLGVEDWGDGLTTKATQSDGLFNAAVAFKGKFITDLSHRK